MLLQKAKDGYDTAFFNEIYLHSRFSPQKEAQKYLKSWEAENNPDSSSFIIVFDPGLGYLLSLLSSIPSKNIVVVFFHQSTAEYCEGHKLLKNLNYWKPDSSISLENFLNKMIGGIPLQNIKIMEWLPCSNAFSISSRDIRKTTLNTIKIHQGNILTSIQFGHRWLTNSIRNFVVNEYSIGMEIIKKDIVIVASGASLNDSISTLKKVAPSYFIVSLPSSAHALISNGIIPDLIITTDPGFYASLHYSDFPEDTVIAAPISAYPFKQGKKILGIHQNTLLDNLIDQNGEILNLKIPEMGTVAATALRGILNYSISNIYILGLDLCIKGIHEHVSPHRFDILSFLNSFRLQPELHNRLDRVRNMAANYYEGYYFTKSMDTYSSWFQKETFGNRVIRINPSLIKLPFQPLKKLPVPKHMSKYQSVFLKNKNYPDLSERKKTIESFLKRWQQAIITGKKDKKTSQLSEQNLAWTQQYFPKTKTTQDIYDELDCIRKRIKNL